MRFEDIYFQRQEKKLTIEEAGNLGIQIPGWLAAQALAQRAKQPGYIRSTGKGK